MGEEHQHALSLRVLGLVREGEDDSFFFPARNAIGVAVGQNWRGFFEVHDHWFSGPGVGRRA